MTFQFIVRFANFEGRFSDGRGGGGGGGSRALGEHRGRMRKRSQGGTKFLSESRDPMVSAYARDPREGRSDG